MATAWLSGFGDEIDPSLDVQMDVMAKVGVHAIELRGVDGRSIAQYSPREAKGLYNRLTDRGFIVSALGSPIGKTPIDEPFQPVLDSFKNLVEVAQALRCGGIRLFSFYMPPGTHAHYRDNVMARLRALKDAAKGSDVMLLHENEGGIYGEQAARNADLARTLGDDNFALIFDPSNYVQAGEDVFVAWQAVKPWVRYFHMKDSVTRRSGDQDNPHRLVGDGDGCVREILADVARTNFKGFFSLEPHLAGSTVVPGSPAQQWVAAAEALKALLAECSIAIEEHCNR
ncbi:MAG: sugar phosphate isomerase/epimerase [Clostridiales bacterium]|nr:sugar phosphate isomerase/epimerase [Clostridiales bacterium]